MAENSKIQWTDHTFNPWRGCTKIAPGCANCYADRQSKRNPKTLGIWGPDGTRVVASEATWREPLKWNKAAENLAMMAFSVTHIYRPRIFCASLADVFEDWPGDVINHLGCAHYTKDGDPTAVVTGEQMRGCVSDGYHYTTLDDCRGRLFRLIDDTPNLDWLVLSKRPENIRRMWASTENTTPVLEEARLPVPGFPRYEVSNLGIVYSLTGSSRCGNCGTAIEGQIRKKYCSSACRCAAYKRAKGGGLRDIYPTEAKVLSQDIGEQGHRRVTLYNGRGESQRVLVHRLVLSVFDKPAPSQQGRHLDGNPANNRLDNLAWGDQSTNWEDSKRHGTHRRYSKLSEEQVDEIRTKAMEGDTFSSLAIQYDVSATQISNIVNYRQWATEQSPLVFRRNCWLGTSVACQEDAEKNVTALLGCRDLAPVLFLSVEPLIESVNLRRFFAHSIRCASYCGSERGFDESIRPCDCGRPRIKWVICGGESGPKARPCHIDWIRSIVRQCREAGVPCFVKQLGAFPIDSGTDGVDKADVRAMPDFYRLASVTDPKGGDASEWPEDLRVRQFPVVTS